MIVTRTRLDTVPAASSKELYIYIYVYNIYRERDIVLDMSGP